MEYPRLLTCLDADFTRLREVAGPHLSAPVPTCPEWTVEQLVEHVGLVYLHKVESMRLPPGTEPPWPPDRPDEPVLALLDRAYAELTGEFAARKPDDPAASWYDPDQTVGFWIRRMAQETVIHRVDAELGAGAPIAEIPADLALDGIDEVLDCFLAFESVRWREYFADNLPSTELPPVLVRAGELGWLVRAAPEGVTVTGAAADATAPAVVRGTPTAVLLWLWRRAADGVVREGDQELIDRLHLLLRDATQ
jgi:uncharacterized protein (TIGR03083 family)